MGIFSCVRTGLQMIINCEAAVIYAADWTGSWLYDWEMEFHVSIFY